ncbi:1-acyl-sn-glycerol-3-phosphate acyltransferase [Streptomyces lavendulae]|uniref:1-acyl-sn-glycerol-3-phosphate acyltransferase n=1 Tax=Streptomyces lavendulae TaxID=1914 RepID=UPI00368CF7C2
MGPSRERTTGTVRSLGTGHRCLVVANHMSWVDPLALVSVEPGSVLARHDVGGWPVIGTLARRAGTVFIDRGSPRQLPVVVGDPVRSPIPWWR